MVEFWELLGFATTVVFSTCSVFMFLYFLKKLLHVRKTTREILPFLGLAFVFLFIGIGFMMYGWIDYIWWDNPALGPIVFQLQNFNGLLIVGSFTGLTFLIEFRLVKTKYVFTIYMALGILTLSFFTGSGDFVLYILIYLVPIALFYIPLWYIVYIRPTSGFLRLRMILALFGLALIVFGILFRFQFMIEDLGIHFYSIGTITGVIGVGIMGYGFSAFSTFTDLDLKEKLSEVFVISEAGICLYAFSFDQNLPLEDTDLIAGGFSGIQGILSEMVRTSESLHLIDYQDVKIMIEQGTNAMFVLIIKEESTFLQYKLKVFSKEFQTFFQETLVNWAGEIDVFKPTGALIQRIFEVNI